jgi:hypothetical protein
MTDTAHPLPQVLTSTEVARLLRRSVRWFRRAQKELHAHGFPPPLAGVGRPPLWSAAAVDRWLRGELPAIRDARSLIGGNVVLFPSPRFSEDRS